MYSLQLPDHLATNEFVLRRTFLATDGELMSWPDEEVKEDAINESLAAVGLLPTAAYRGRVRLCDDGTWHLAEVLCAGFPVVA
jgi:hypothetical protein